MSLSEPRYFRLRTRGRFLTYHVEGCRYLRNRADRIVEVSEEEVDRAIEAGRFAQVDFEGGRFALNVCLSCWRWQNGKPWPETGRVAIGPTPSSAPREVKVTLPPSDPSSPAHDEGSLLVSQRVRTPESEEDAMSDREEMLAELDRQLEAMDGIMETYSEVFGGSPGGAGRLEVIEVAWEAASRAMDALRTVREQTERGG